MNKVGKVAEAIKALSEIKESCSKIVAPVEYLYPALEDNFPVFTDGCTFISVPKTASTLKWKSVSEDFMEDASALLNYIRQNYKTVTIINETIKRGIVEIHSIEYVFK